MSRLLDRSYPNCSSGNLWQAREPRLNRMPGAAAAVSDSLPPYGGIMATPYSLLNVEGRPRLPEGAGGMAGYRTITPGYFAALGIPILRGRGFRQQDRAPGAAAIVLGEAARIDPARTLRG